MAIGDLEVLSSMRLETLRNDNTPPTKREMLLGLTVAAHEVALSNFLTQKEANWQNEWEDFRDTTRANKLAGRSLAAYPDYQNDDILTVSAIWKYNYAKKPGLPDETLTLEVKAADTDNNPFPGDVRHSIAYLHAPWALGRKDSLLGIKAERSSNGQRVFPTEPLRAKVMDELCDRISSVQVYYRDQAFPAAIGPDQTFDQKPQVIQDIITEITGVLNDPHEQLPALESAIDAIPTSIGEPLVREHFELVVSCLTDGRKYNEATTMLWSMRHLNHAIRTGAWDLSPVALVG